VDVGGLPNHVKYCVSVLSLQWANIRTSPVGIPYIMIGLKKLSKTRELIKTKSIVYDPSNSLTPHNSLTRILLFLDN